MPIARRYQDATTMRPASQTTRSLAPTRPPLSPLPPLHPPPCSPSARTSRIHTSDRYPPGAVFTHRVESPLNQQTHPVGWAGRVHRELPLSTPATLTDALWEVTDSQSLGKSKRLALKQRQAVVRLVVPGVGLTAHSTTHLSEYVSPIGRAAAYPCRAWVATFNQSAPKAAPCAALGDNRAPIGATQPLSAANSRGRSFHLTCCRAPRRCRAVLDARSSSSAALGTPRRTGRALSQQFHLFGRQPHVLQGRRAS